MCNLNAGWFSRPVTQLLLLKTLNRAQKAKNCCPRVLNEFSMEIFRAGLANIVLRFVI